MISHFGNFGESGRRKLGISKSYARHMLLQLPISASLKQTKFMKQLPLGAQEENRCLYRLCCLQLWKIHWNLIPYNWHQHTTTASPPHPWLPPTMDVEPAAAEGLTVLSTHKTNPAGINTGLLRGRLCLVLYTLGFTQHSLILSNFHSLKKNYFE